MPAVGIKEQGLFRRSNGFPLTHKLTLELLWMRVPCGPVLLAPGRNHRHPFQDEQLSWWRKGVENGEGTSRRLESRNPTQAVGKAIFFLVWQLRKRSIFGPVQNLEANKGMTSITRQNPVSFEKKKVVLCRWMLFIYLRPSPLPPPPPKYPSEMLRVFSKFFFIQLTDSLTCAHNVCRVVQEAYPGGKIGAGSINSLSFFSKYNMPNSYKRCKTLFFFLLRSCWWT